MKFDNKIAIVIKNDLKGWQKLNVVSFLAGSVAIKFPETHGKELINASNSSYLPFMKQPVMIYKADTDADLKRAFSRSKDRELSIGVYIDDLFATKCEEENHEMFAKYDDENQPLVGIVVYGENRKVDKALNGLKFHE